MVADHKEKVEKTVSFKQPLSLIKKFLNWIDTGQKRKPACKA
jgi:hypothetical protein